MAVSLQRKSASLSSQAIAENVIRGHFLSSASPASPKERGSTEYKPLLLLQKGTLTRSVVLAAEKLICRLINYPN